MVLLLIMQHMQGVKWGLTVLFVEVMNATEVTKATKVTDSSAQPKIQVKNDGINDIGMVILEIDLEPEERMTLYGPRGRTTNVFSVKSALVKTFPGKWSPSSIRLKSPVEASQTYSRRCRRLRRT
jgi:hypothetical protein